MPQYDSALRRRAVRKGRETGAWIFVPAAELELAGVELRDGAGKLRSLFYTVARMPRRRIIVSFHLEP